MNQIKNERTRLKAIPPNRLKYHNKRVAVSMEICFDAAHHLEMYADKCRNLHGHTYRLTVTVSGYVNDVGMVIDFAELKKIFTDLLMERIDHQYLNAVLPEMNPTVDNMVVWVWEQFEQGLQDRGYSQQCCRLEEIKLFETPTCCATLKREWMYQDE
jgi:6-pyruvoyltetrahydropterin/6-carboxytetrahydropterin synthase